MTEELIALGRRAVACKGFKFCEGMAVFDDSGATGVVVALGPRWQDNDPFWEPQNKGAIGEGLVVWRPGYGVTALHGWLPDMSKPATLGCVLALVERTYDQHCRIAMGDLCVLSLRMWRSGIAGSGPFQRFVGKRRSEVLIAALEAAP